ncbi:class I adenylate-forming enzyme family protein [Yinghuangia seranimata]|uniref:class I adenylate-forming enzyme family protein n=1 Tax=Yinghuangia seranimata TaxID=408067 RepID=UPI00248C14FA|nr:class I adenylate-forming enzyme family protein [Yinghuangia seranimata]MDI2132576.1 class I adenylate-forming enzyme family protein [Yinghuangia seranimata]
MLDRTQALDALTGPGSVYAIAPTHRHDGVPWREFPAAPATLRTVFEATAAFGASDALVHEDGRISYDEQLRLVGHFARHLSDGLGVRHGDRVAIAMRNHPEWSLAFWAAQVIGAVAVPLNAWWTADELRYALEDSGAAVLIADGERADRLAAHAAEYGGELVPGNVRAVLVAHREGPLPDEVFDLSAALVAWAGPCPLPPGGPEPDDDATILYTSGTTGRPKGAVGTHRNHTTNIHTMQLLQSVQLARAGVPPELLTGGLPHFLASMPDLPRQSALQTYPFFHIAGIVGLYIAAAQGAKLSLMRRWDTERALQIIETERVTNASMVPTLLRRLLESPLRAKYDLSSLLSLGAGGAPVPPDLVGEVGRMSGRAVSPLNGYGMTETTCVVVANSGEEYYANPDSVGRPVPVVDVAVVDPATGRQVAAGETGEIRFRGPHVVRGYWNRPEESEECFPDGWFRTGDLGHVDADGFVYVVDRLKDVIIRGGENVYSAEVEAVLFEHPAVADVAVVGVPHRELGEEVAAVVETHPGAVVTAAELRGHVARRLAAFKVPTTVRFSDRPLPRNAVGKVLKRELRDMLSL